MKSFLRLFGLLAIACLAVLGPSRPGLADPAKELKGGSESAPTPGQSDPAPAKSPASPPDPRTATPEVQKWVTDRMKKWSPAGRSFLKEAKETKEEGEDRYDGIASALISVVYDPSEEPIVGGKNARSKSLAILMALSWFESGFRRDVDLGLGSLGRGDNGKSWCMVQVLLGLPNKDGKTEKRVVLGPDGDIQIVHDKTASVGWGGEDLVADRTKCFRTGLRLLRKSFNACPGQHFDDRISTYGAGQCFKEWEPSRIRVRRAKRWLAEVPPPMGDQTVISALFPTLPPATTAPQPVASRP